MTHTCPARGCSRQVLDHLLMCGADWRRLGALPDGPQLQRAVYAAYAGGAGMMPGGLPGPALVAAQSAAIDAVNGTKRGRDGRELR